MDQKDKCFIDMYTLAIQRVPSDDQYFYKKLASILKAKQRVDMSALSTQPSSVSNLIKEKDKLQKELQKALNDIDNLKTIVAQNTLMTMHT